MEIKATSALDLCLTFIDQNVLKGKRARNSKQVRCARVAGCILAKLSSSLMNSFTETEIKPLSPFLRHNSDIDIGKTKQQWILIIEMMSAWRRLNLQPKDLLYIHNIQKTFLSFLKTCFVILPKRYERFSMGQIEYSRILQKATNTQQCKIKSRWVPIDIYLLFHLVFYCA